MGRKIRKVKSQKRTTEWIFKVNVELTYNNRPKIAFLSGLQRSYYPEDPGVSKFGIINSVNFDESPPCTFTPPEDKLQKPISTVGYGIGGLSAPRFPKLLTSETIQTSPDRYQPLLNEKRLVGHRRKVPPEEDFFQLPPYDPYIIKKKLDFLEQKHRQCNIGFGTLKSTARFGNPPLFNTAGVGSYHADVMKAPPLQISSSFGSSPIIKKPSTEIRCVHDPSSEKCIECGQSLEIIDFYRTRFSVRVPQPETRAPTELDKNFPKGIHRVNLCNICYHKAAQGLSKNWPKTKVRWLFQKTRTCATVHDHQNVSEVIHKARCSMVRKLQRKEAVLSKYYSDRVEESILPAEYYLKEKA